ncbi:LysR family transcriptional regulator, partial [Mesorhizobium sp. M7A.F.Ca.US.005.03.2.1]
LSALAYRVVPPGLIEVGRKLGLPPIPPSEIVLQSHALPPRAREALHMLATAFREYNSPAE